MLSKMRWGESDTCKFAKLYMRNECLWNTEHPDYKLKHRRSHAFKELIAEFYDCSGIKLTEIEVRIKIKNLRSTYYQEVNKIKSRSNAGSTYKPTIKWFNYFHKHLHRWRKGDEGFDDINQSFSTQDEAEEGCQEIWTAPHTLGNPEPFPDTDSDYKLLVLKPEPNENSHIEEEESSFKIKKKKMKRRRTSAENSDKIFRNSLDSSSESTKEDEFDIYGKYIASQLRKMNLQKALRIQLAIQSLVSEARISDIAET